MTDDALIDHLRKIHMFSSLSRPSLERLSQNGSRQEFKAGDVIVEEGSVGDTMFLILSGEVTARKTTDAESGEYLVIATMFPGDIFGEMALFEQQPRSATIVARVDVSVFVISRAVFDDVLQAEPAEARVMLHDVITTVSSRLRLARQEMSVVYEISKIIGADQDSVVGLADAVLDELLQDFPAASLAVLAAWPEFSEDATTVSARNMSQRDIDEFVLERSHPLAQQMRRSRETFLLSHLPDDHIFAPLVTRPAPDGKITHSLLVSPMLVKDQLIGFILLGRESGKRFTISQAHLMTILANLVGVAFAHAVQLQERLAQERKSRLFYGRHL